MVQPSRSAKTNLSVHIGKLQVPRKHLLKTELYSDNLPIDIQVKIRVLVNETQELIPFIFSDFQKQIDYFTDYVLYGFDYVIEFPLLVSQLSKTTLLEVAIEGHEISMQKIVKVFINYFGELKMNSGLQTISFEDINLQVCIHPHNKDTMIIYVPDLPVESLKRTYRPQQKAPLLTLADYQQMTTDIKQQQLLQTIEMERQFFEFENFKNFAVSEQVGFKNNLLEQQFSYSPQQVSPISKSYSLDVIQLADTLKQSKSTQKVLDQMYQDLNSDGTIFQDNIGQVQILSQTDYIKISNYFTQNVQNQPVFNKNPIDFTYYNQAQIQQLSFDNMSMAPKTSQVPDYLQQQLLIEIISHPVLHNITNDKAKQVQQFQQWVMTNIENSFYRVVQSSVICETYTFEKFSLLKSIPTYQALMLLTDSKTRELGVHYLKNMQASHVQSIMMELTLNIGQDVNNELSVFMKDICTNLDNLYMMSQYYFYVECWRQNFSDKGDQQKEQKLAAASREYLAFLEDRSMLKNQPTEDFYKQLKTTILFISELRSLIKSVKEAQPADRILQKDMLVLELQKKQAYPHLLGDDPVMYPFIMRGSKPAFIKGLNPSKSHVFKSAKKPFLIFFNEVMDNGDIKDMPILHKFNDDVRNDVMVLQLFKVMESQLTENGIKLEPAHNAAFAFDSKFGIIECIMPSISLDDIIEKHKTVPEYFKQCIAQDSKINPIDQLVKYTKSSALYSIMTYILAIGDRHGENILFCPDGKVFHIDFGWLFARDPKPKPALMKISPEMVLGFGGVDSQYFMQFVNYLISSYSILRRESNYILALLIMLKDSGIKVVEEDIQKNFDWLQTRLCVGLNEDEANFQMMQILNGQLSAVFPKVIDALHRFIQSTRK